MSTGPAQIELFVQRAALVFDELDPSPLSQKDLNPKVEAYIVESVRELSGVDSAELVFCLGEAADASLDDTVMAGAVRAHFARSSRHSQRELRRLLKRGGISMAIGLGFLAALISVSHGVERFLGPRPFVAFIREGLMIGGWVAMWRPLEILLYDWWPIMGQRRLYDRLSRISVRIIQGNKPMLRYDT